MYIRSMKRMLFFAFLILVFISCKDQKQIPVEDGSSEYELSTEKWPKKLPVNSNAQAILNDWKEFKAFETTFDALYNVENKDDLALAIDDLIEKQKDLVASTYPDKFDIPQIRSRQKIFKTYMLKIKGDLFYRLDPQESILQMFEAYNAFRNQFNVVVNNTLDTNLILEE